MVLRSPSASCCTFCAERQTHQASFLQGRYLRQTAFFCEFFFFCVVRRSCFARVCETLFHLLPRWSSEAKDTHHQRVWTNLSLPGIPLFVEKKRALYFLGIVAVLVAPSHPAPLFPPSAAGCRYRCLSSGMHRWYSLRHVWLAPDAVGCSHCMLGRNAEKHCTSSRGALTNRTCVAMHSGAWQESLF